MVASATMILSVSCYALFFVLSLRILLAYPRAERASVGHFFEFGVSCKRRCPRLAPAAQEHSLVCQLQLVDVFVFESFTRSVDGHFFGDDCRASRQDSWLKNELA